MQIPTSYSTHGSASTTIVMENTWTNDLIRPDSGFKGKMQIITEAMSKAWMPWSAAGMEWSEM